MRIRHTLHKEIIAVLDYSQFTAADFLLDFPDHGEVVIRVTFKTYPDFKITLSMKDNIFSLGECPADFYYRWTTQAYNFKEFTKSLKSWVRKIDTELRAITPILDDFEELRREVEIQIHQHAHDINSYFTEVEASNITVKLDLFGRLLEQHAETHSELKKDLINLLKQLLAAKATIEAFPKKVWLSTTFNKFLTYLKPLMKSKDVRQVAVEGMKALMFNSIVDGNEGIPNRNRVA